MNSARAAVVAVLGVLFLGACATYMGSPPVAELTTARSAITQAEAAGAGQLAPVELLAARGKMVQAEAAVRAEQFERALRLAEQAAADGALAERKARAARARMAATELERGNAALKQEISRPAQ